MENINLLIKERIRDLKNSDYKFSSLYEIIHSNGERIFCEYLENYQIVNVTYFEMDSLCKKCATLIKNKILDKEEYVGILMDNSIEFLTSFWALLMLGYKPVLLNNRLPESMLNEVKRRLSIKTVLVKDEALANKNNILVELSKIKECNELNKFKWADEIALTTTATSLNIKVCVYTGKDFTYQVLNAEGICKTNFMIKEHYKGRMKLLTFLPFYHIFGLVATYFWFSVFGRSFVLLDNYSPDTIINTVKRHKVTHLFAVPMVWHIIYNEIIKIVDSKDENTKKKFYNGINTSISLQTIDPNLGRKVVNKLFKEVQDQVFGDSIKFMISGGGYINKDALRVLNGIGYPLYVGYGMSEVGITSVELRPMAKYRVMGTIGKPFDSIEYKIEDDILYIRGKSICSKIITDKETIIIDHDEFFKTNDIAKKLPDGSYVISGRNDDVFISSNGEKINPDYIESELNFKTVNSFSVLGIDKKLSLVIELSRNYSDIKVKRILDEIKEKVNNKYIEKIYFTYDEISNKNAIKVSRALLLKRIKDKEVKLLSISDFDNIEKKDITTFENDIKNTVKKVFADILNVPIKNIKDNSHFIFDLGGSSLDYLSLLVELEKIYDIKFNFEGKSPSSIIEFSEYITKVVIK